MPVILSRLSKLVIIVRTRLKHAYVLDFPFWNPYCSSLTILCLLMNCVRRCMHSSFKDFWYNWCSWDYSHEHQLDQNSFINYSTKIVLYFIFFVTFFFLWRDFTTDCLSRPGKHPDSKEIFIENGNSPEQHFFFFC